MEIALSLIIGILVGAILVYFVIGRRISALNADNQRLAIDAEANSRLLAQERTSFEERLLSNDRLWEQKLTILRQDIQRITTEQLSARQQSLQESNRTQIDAILSPLKEQFAEFKKSVDESKTQNTLNKNDLKTTFENTLKLFQQEQTNAVTQLREQTTRLGEDAVVLAKALKGESKTQGDWGEMVLQQALENSGLEEGVQYLVQYSVADEDKKQYRPDVIVKFPEGRSVIIDSKVSISDYISAVNADNDKDREAYLRAHVASVRRHIDELASKDYTHVVSDAIGFVLMFIPNESSYIAAMRQCPTLSREAYDKRIIIISPSNLLMALQLAYNLWQCDKQNRNVEKIVDAARNLYDKVAGFTDSYNSMGVQLRKALEFFDKAENQLYKGTGNILRRIELLKEMGVTPSKAIKNNDKIEE